MQQKKAWWKRPEEGQLLWQHWVMGWTQPITEQECLQEKIKYPSGDRVCTTMQVFQSDSGRVWQQRELARTKAQQSFLSYNYERYQELSPGSFRRRIE